MCKKGPPWGRTVQLLKKEREREKSVPRKPGWISISQGQDNAIIWLPLQGKNVFGPQSQDPHLVHHYLPMAWTMER